jgi:hypothetical protein
VNANKPEPVDTKSLYIKVKAALQGGKLDISNCEITETFDLEKLILAHKNNISEDEIQKWDPSPRFLHPTNVYLPRQNVKIPFEINARHTVFNCEVQMGGEKEYYFEKKWIFSRSVFNRRFDSHQLLFKKK